MPRPAYEPAHCIVCGHARSEVVAEAAEIEHQVEDLWAFHQRRLEPTTPVDRLRDRVAFSQHPPLRLVACLDCGLVYRNPTERGFEVTSTYARDCPPREILQALHDAQRPTYRGQARRLGKLLHRGASVLEVGSYVGAFLSAARDAGLQAAGVDVNPSVNDFVRSLGFPVNEGELSSVRPAKVDAIAIWNTFDQLTDPRGVVVAARARLRTGGVLAIRVPNGAFYKSWSGRLRGTGGTIARAVLAHNNLLTFPYRWGFGEQSLTALLADLGFSTVAVAGDVLVPTSDGWSRSWTRVEEQLTKQALRLAGRVGAAWPWIEVYATAVEPAA